MESPPLFLSFNAFGLVKITRTKVTVQATAITTTGKAINRSLIEEFPPLTSIVPYEFGSAIFGADLTDQKQRMIAYNEISTLASEKPVGQIPQVTKAVEKVLDLILLTAKPAN